MGHQADAGDNRVRTVVALQRPATPAEDADAIVRAELGKRKVHLVIDPETVEAQTKVGEDFVQPAPACLTAQQATCQRPDEPVAADPAIALGLTPEIQAKTAHRAAVQTSSEVKG